jgi:hypothetical protein
MEPMNQKQVDWNLLKFQYEVLGVSAEQLAEENPNTSLGLIQDAIQEQHWIAGSIDSLVPVIQQEDNEAAALEQYTNATKAHLVGANLLKQKALFPEFAKVEAVLLSKVAQAALAVDANDEKACHRLNNLVKSLQGLLANNQFLTTTIDQDADPNGNGFTVQIVNQVS